MEMGCHMYIFRKLKIVLCMFLLFLFFIVETAVALDIKPNNIGLSIAIVVAAIATIIGIFFTLGGIKYVTPENVLNIVV